MKLKSITIQNMHNVGYRTYNFNNLNYFYGKNGAGKSTVLQAVQLALLGYIPGYSKTKDGIFSHCNQGGMTVTLTIDNDNEDIIVIREYESSGKTIKTNVTITPETYQIEGILAGLELPIFNFSEFMNLSANKMKDWFIDFLPGITGKVDFDYHIRNSIKDITQILDEEFVDNTIAYAESLTGGDALQKVRDFNAYLKELQSFTKGQLSRIQNTVESLILYDNIETNTDIDALNNKLIELDTEKSKLTTDISTINNNKIVYEKLEMFKPYITADTIENDEEYINLKKQHQYILDEYNELVQDTAMLKTKVTELTKSLKDTQSIIAGNGLCPYTNTICDSIVKKITDLKIQNMQDNDTINSLNETIKNNTQTLNNMKSSEVTISSKLKTIETAYTQTAMLNSMVNHDVENMEVSIITDRINDINSESQKITDTIIKIKSNLQYETMMHSLTNEKYKTEQQLDLIKIWLKLTDVNGLQSKIMSDSFATLETTVTDYLRQFFKLNDISAKFNLESKANSFSFGIQNGNMYISYDLLSSGEKCLFMLSLMIGIIKSSETKLPLILIDDFIDHLDNNRTDSIFDVLYNINDIQFIIAGVKACNHLDSDSFVIKVE